MRPGAAGALMGSLLGGHPLVLGLVGAVVATLVLDVDLGLAECASCWADTVDNNAVPPGIGGLAGPLGQIGKDFIEHRVGRPFFFAKDMYDIASGDTDEEQARTAFDKLWDLLLISDAPKGSVAGDLQDASDRMLDWAGEGDESKGEP